MAVAIPSLMRGGLLVGMAVLLVGCEPLVLDMSRETGSGSFGVFHPDGYDSPDVHGLALNMAEQNCVGCHGQTLQGSSSGPTCDGCHKPDWKSDCTFCHGGTDNATGAPPRELDGATAIETLRFRAHSAHVGTPMMAAPMECDQCHAVPADALTPGHILDSTPAVAEVVFDRGISASGTYDGAGTCASLYCHGNGRGDNGVVSHDEGTMTCQSCHPTDQLSGEHGKHLETSPITCSDCHAVAAPDETIVKRVLHVDGKVDVDIAEPNITRNGLRCTGACHGFDHDNDNWN